MNPKVYSSEDFESKYTYSGELGFKWSPEKTFFRLWAPTATAQVMKAVGVNYCGISNNHFFDYGIKGATDSLKYLKEAGIIATGFGENYEDSRRDLVIEKDLQKIAFITVCEHEYSYALDDRMGSRPFDCFDTISDVRKAKEKYDRVIVIYHGGKEFCAYPSPRLEKLYHALADNGADMVIGNRFLGGIEPGAMPRLHRYIGNPFLSGLGKCLYHVEISDFHCGLRAARKDVLLALGLCTTKMEFASEMIVKAALAGIKIKEIPCKLYKDKRGRKSHLRSFRDGVRHVLFLIHPAWFEVKGKRGY